MSDHKIDRRTFLKIMGTAGATAAAVSVAGPAAIGEAAWQQPAKPGRMTLNVPQSPDTTVAALPKAKLQEMYVSMFKSRRWEEGVKDNTLGGKDGIYGACHAYVGEEAVAAGVSANLNKDDWIVSTHRGHGHLIAKGGDLNKMSAEIYAKSDGYNKGFGGSMHITDLSLGILGMNGIVGASWYIGAGAAYYAKVKGTKQVAIAYAGDGAANSPYFFSAVRNAVIHQLPVIFVVENNMYQMTVPMWATVPTGDVSNYTQGLPLPSVSTDGMDVNYVYAFAKEAIDRARAGNGPSVIEFKTYRYYDHFGFAGAKIGQLGSWGLPIQPDGELQAYIQRDPIPKFRAFLTDRKLFTDAELKTIESDVQKAVDASFEFARKSPVPKQQDGLTNVYSKGSVPATQFWNAQIPASYVQDKFYVQGIDSALET